MYYKDKLAYEWEKCPTIEQYDEETGHKCKRIQRELLMVFLITMSVINNKSQAAARELNLGAHHGGKMRVSDALLKGEHNAKCINEDGWLFKHWKIIIVIYENAVLSDAGSLFQRL